MNSNQTSSFPADTLLIINVALLLTSVIAAGISFAQDATASGWVFVIAAVGQAITTSIVVTMRYHMKHRKTSNTGP